MSAPPSTVDAAVDWLRKRFDSEAARDLQAVYQIDLVGPEGGSVVVRVDRGVAEIEPGEDAAPDARFRASAEDWAGILSGQENADLLYMAGRLEIEGELAQAMKIRALFRRKP